MNTPEQDHSIASRVVGTFKGILDQVGYFVTHLDGDFDWEGSKLDSETLLGQPEPFNPRSRMRDLLDSPKMRVAVGVSTILIFCLAISRIEQSLGLSNNSLMKIFSAFFFTPGR